MHAFFTFPLWQRAFWYLLTSRPSMRFFLEKTWGAKDIDEALFEYDYLSAHQPGAWHAPYYFVSGYLFSADVSGTSFLPAIVVPIPLIARTQSKACNALADQLKLFIVAEEEV